MLEIGIGVFLKKSNKKQKKYGKQNRKICPKKTNKK